MTPSSKETRGKATKKPGSTVKRGGEKRGGSKAETGAVGGGRRTTSITEAERLNKIVDREPASQKQV